MAYSPSPETSKTLVDHQPFLKRHQCFDCAKRGAPRRAPRRSARKSDNIRLGTGIARRGGRGSACDVGRSIWLELEQQLEHKPGNTRER